MGRVVTAKDATHFSGSSQLSIELTHRHGRLSGRCGDRRVYQARKWPRQEHGGEDERRAAVGAILGGLLGGGKGAAIGTVTGGGVGAGVNGVTRGQQVQIPTETLVSFHLQSPISVTTSKPVGGSHGGDELQQRQ